MRYGYSARMLVIAHQNRHEIEYQYALCRIGAGT